MEDAELYESIWRALYADIHGPGAFPESRPLLAHYTSLAVLEKILEDEEIWFSNPLLMNDVEEVVFGIREGSNLVLQSDEIRMACLSIERHKTLRDAFQSYLNKFTSDHVLDTYVLCLAEHDQDDKDGALSMWRGYGSNGNGAAIVFATDKIGVVPESALLISKVQYASSSDRVKWLRRIVAAFVSILQNQCIEDDKLHFAAFALFEGIKLFALTTKHIGFKEEREWRVIYLKSRDHKEVFAPMFKHSIGPRGIEPKLKLPIVPIYEHSDQQLSLINIIDKILLGPCVGSPLAYLAISRMLDSFGKSDLKHRVFASTIPFRAI